MLPDRKDRNDSRVDGIAPQAASNATALVRRFTRRRHTLPAIACLSADTATSAGCRAYRLRQATG
jgi:hypothetical protein